jgi:hypothetical protein
MAEYRFTACVEKNVVIQPTWNFSDSPCALEMVCSDSWISSLLLSADPTGSNFACLICQLWKDGQSALCVTIHNSTCDC